MGEQCSLIEENLRKNNSKRTYQLVKDLTNVKQGKATTIQDRSGKCLTEEREILNRWTEYCNHKASGDPSVLDCPRQTQTMTTPSFAKKWKLQYNHWREGSRLESTTYKQNWSKQVERMFSLLSQQSAKKAWQTGEWPTPWTQSLVITLPTKATCSSARPTERSASSVS